MFKSLIYCVTNNINNKKYIGQTISTLAQRKRQHKYTALKENSPFRFYKAIRKYGWEHFTWSILEILTESSLDMLLQITNDKEKTWINQLNTLKNGYNATLGGDGGGMRGKKASQETRNKMSLAHMGKKLSPLSIERKKMIGKQHSKAVICLENGILYSSMKEAAVALNIHISSVRQHLRGYLKQAYGYHFKFAPKELSL